MRPDYEVVVAGAGPAGCGVALRLAQIDPRLAERTLVLDRATFPRAKPCGGGLTGHAEDAMRALDIPLEVDAWPAPGAVVRFGEFERRVVLARPVRVVRREEFDHSLVRLARRRGVDVVEGEGVVAFERVADGVRVRTRRRTLTCRVLVGADGAASVVRKTLHAGRRQRPHRLFKLELPAPPGRPPAADMVYDFTPMVHGLRGYLWVFPVPGNRLNVGLMHYPSRVNRGGGDLVSLLRDGLAEHGLALPDRGVRGWPAWGYHPRAPVSAPGVVTVGDAAGIDALTGEGIAVALEHAIVAGDAIADALRTGDRSFADYRRRLRRAVVGRELALDRWLAWLLYRGRGAWRRWLPLVLFDPEVIELYAARVSGTAVLADHKLRLYRALARHVVKLPGRARALRAAAPPAALLPAA